MGHLRKLASMFVLVAGSAHGAPLQEGAEAPATPPEVSTPAPAPVAPPPAAPAKLDFDTWRALPKELDYEPGMAIPAGYVHKKKIRLAPVIAGSTMLGTAWLASAAATRSRRSSRSSTCADGMSVWSA